ncbi:MAG TPA: tRNA (guanosine(37)-N1)-methyltransferase TrmD [Burkholderiaceae bacterium]|nr:tRNA (guanosine(37)-N1)-methyltransferase TrmD [Burkholderiaceae bacterium]
MRFDAITLFPQMFDALSQYGVTRRAHERGLWRLRTWNPRDFTQDVHRTVDDRPFGGGPGMVLMAEPLARALEAARTDAGAEPQQRQPTPVPAPWVVCLSAGGRPLTDARVRQFAAEGAGGRGLILVCGRYEGIDQRFVDEMVDEEISIGDFVLSGGEIAAMGLIDAVVRQLPGALKEESVREESFADGQLDGPQYTRPESWRGRPVPPVLLCGDHARIERWRRDQSLQRTRSLRPDLLQQKAPV